MRSTRPPKISTTNLESQLKDIKINKSLLSSASRNKAINPDQVVELLKSDIKLNEAGNVEILDKSGLARYNKLGELLSTDELVQEFLTQNPHFVSATPSGSGSVSNVDRQELNKPLNLSDLDMNNLSNLLCLTMSYCVLLCLTVSYCALLCISVNVTEMHSKAQ